MTRNLKALALALVAVFALSAMLASAASAQTQGKLTTENGENVTFTTEELSAGAESLTAFGVQIKCPGSEYTGHKYNVTPHGFVPNGAEAVTITPHYNQANCLAANTFPATVTINGCDYVLHVGQTTGTSTAERKTYGATFDVLCPANTFIEIEMWEQGQNHATTKPWCTVKVGSQAGLTGGHITSTPFSDDIDLDGTISGISVSRSGAKPVLCASGSEAGASLVLGSTVTADNEAGAEVGITVTDEEVVEGGFNTLTTENGENVTLTTEELSAGAESLTAFGVQIKCPGSEYTGHKYNVTPHGFVPNGAEAVTITPHYNQANCLAANTFPMTITMNGCDYVLHIGQTTGTSTAERKTYGATFDVLCPANTFIEIEMWEQGQNHATTTPWCTMKVGSQAGLTGGHITSTPFSDDIDLDGTISGISVSRSGAKPVLCASGSEAGASLVLGSTVTADNEEGEEVGITVAD